jgi:murein DD-endopeptidase MepM/ murein hydrolase activator NlpD
VTKPFFGWGMTVLELNVDDNGRVVSPVPGVEPGYPGLLWHQHPHPPNRYANRQNWHTGVDWSAEQGSLIVSVNHGTVVMKGVASSGGAYGNWLRIRDKKTKRVFMYCHMSKMLANVGDTVKPNEVIGLVGSTGHVTGPHLHMELSRQQVWIYNDTLNPLEGW